MLGAIRRGISSYYENKKSIFDCIWVWYASCGNVRLTINDNNHGEPKAVERDNECNLKRKLLCKFVRQFLCEPESTYALGAIIRRSTAYVIRALTLCTAMTPRKG